MSKFNIGDILTISADQDSDYGHDLPDEPWDAIVIDVDPEDTDRIEVAWLSRFSTPVNAKGRPIRETWDDKTTVIDVCDIDDWITLKRRASYADAIA